MSKTFGFKKNNVDVPFVNEVEEFNSTFNKPNNYEPTISAELRQGRYLQSSGRSSADIRRKRKNGNSYMTLYLKNWKNIDRLAKTETSWKFWMLCVILLMFPLGTGLCYMALKIRYGRPIKKYKQAICLSLAALKRKPWKLSPSALKNKLSHVTTRR